MSCAGSGTQTTTPTLVGVYIGMDHSAAGGLEICASSSHYLDFAIINTDYKGKLSYINCDSSLNRYAGANATATPDMK